MTNRELIHVIHDEIPRSLSEVPASSVPRMEAQGWRRATPADMPPPPARRRKKPGKRADTTNEEN